MLTGVLYSVLVGIIRSSVFPLPAEDDFEPLEEVGEVTASNPEMCHNITIVDDDFIEPPEDLEATLRRVFNVADVNLSPALTTVTIVDADGKNISVDSKYTCTCTVLSYILQYVGKVGIQ